MRVQTQASIQNPKNLLNLLNPGYLCSNGSYTFFTGK